MKLTTITLNPALDRTMYFDSAFAAGELNRASSSMLSLGGKGINVSRVAKLMGHDTECVSFCGGRNGEIMRAMLAEEGIPSCLISTACESRMNLKMIDREGSCTEANERGGPVTEAEMQTLTDRLFDSFSTDRAQVYALGGSIPQGVEKSVYKMLTNLLKSRGAYVILDCDGEALKQGLEAAPHLIKPNLFELSLLVGRELSTTEEAVENAYRIFGETGTAVLCTLGGKGAFLACERGVCTVTSPQVPLRGFTGAGDTFLASFVCATAEGKSIEDALAFASSTAAAKVTLPGTELPRREMMGKYLGEVETKWVR